MIRFKFKNKAPLFFLLLLLSACGTFKREQKQPTLELTISTSQGINPGIDYPSNPVFLRIYQLAGYEYFQQARFLELYRGSASQALGNQLVLEHPQIVLKPGETATYKFTVQPQTAFVGAFVQFHQFEGATNKAWIPISREPGKQNRVNLFISGLTVKIESGK
ncbi:type VI secretion system lipoprotein TssJ [Parendozoicomonas callyspongiae]|uniref:type VI secretion system lipoprotein TssJ n=1 Tax=Parendozoicomonas callyspongiae TaxID=2942213 RepID=UPI0038CD9B13